MKYLFTIILTFVTILSFSQEKEEQELLAMQKANDYVYQGNEKANSEDYIAAEMDYRKAISSQETNVAGAYNLGTSYYKKGNLDEALYRLTQAAKNATNKENKHKAYHNIGNILMQNKKCKEAVEAYKNALRNNPSDEETRYNLGLAKECAEQQEDQQDQNQDQNEDQENKDENKDQEDQKDKEGDNKEDNKDEGDQDKKDGEDQEDDKGEPKDDKQDQGKEGDNEKKEQQKPQQQPGQLSPQQIKNLLEAMNNQEEKVQEKINAEKQKGVKVQTDKDW
ncbi:tetratricopeptide repeat protein [Corallibacter sp.]|uniref:tetratricopeptide repeat protein n=1 Tax=Corallibacter sp. TaxID=2038084 RepID=UPI003AB1B88F